MDYDKFKSEYEKYMSWEVKDPVVPTVNRDDRVNSPSHYTSGKTEAIDVIEDAISQAPDVTYGFLQGQVLKYLLRMWLKDNPLEDAKKAQWYLSRLIDKADGE